MRGILFDSKGEKLSTHQIFYQTVPYPDGRVEQDPADWTRSLEKICSTVSKEAIEKHMPIQAVAVTSQRSSIVPIDREGKPLTHTIMWQDRRNAEICQELESCNDFIFQKSGAAVNTVFSGSRMTWVRRNLPEVYKNVYKFVNIPEYVMHHMTGTYKTDVTYGSRSHLMNLRERRWDEQMLELFQVQEEHLCTLEEPGSVMGWVSRTFAAVTGLPEGIPVISSGGDQQCAAIGQGAFREGTLSLVLGTGGFLVTAVDEVPENLSKRLICNCSSVRGRYMVEGNVLTCCSAFDWLCRNFYGMREERKPDYEEVSRELMELDGVVSPVMVLPYFQGRSTPEWNPKVRAVFGKISLASGRKEIGKGLLEGIFMEIQNNIRLFSDYAGIHRIYISGGMTKNAMLNQLQADVYGIPLYRMEDSEATALGALITALVGQKVYGSFEEAFEKLRGREQIVCYEPRSGLHEQYERKRLEMNQMYQKIC